MIHLDPNKLHVKYLNADASVFKVPRRYTLTHSDSTGDLFLTIGDDYDFKQISGWYTKLMGDEVLAEWLNDPTGPALHVGCMRCQKVCAYNKDVISWSEYRGEFTEDETEYLLKGEFSGKKGIKIGRKISRVGLDLTIFPKNLTVLLGR